MKLEFIPKFIMLLAGAIVSIITIVKDMDVTYSLALLLATLVIFYIVGLIAKKIIQKTVEGNMFKRQQGQKEENVEFPEQGSLEESSDSVQVSGGGTE